MRLPNRWMSRSFAVVGFTVLLYGAAAAITGWGEFRAGLADVPLALAAPLVGLSLMNYLLRFGRWQLLLGRLGVVLPAAWSARLYFSTFLMVITPGKIGEAFKAGVMHEQRGVPLGLGLPAVVAERIYDLLGVLLIAAAGLLLWPGPLGGVTTALVAAASVPIGLALLRSRRVREQLVARASRAPFLRDRRPALGEALEALSQLLAPGPALAALMLSTVAWAAECFSLWLLCRALGLPVGPGEAFFIYAAATLVGSLSFLPGGLGGTEAVIVALLSSLGVTVAEGLTVALVVRLVTLWLAVVLGAAVFLASRGLWTDRAQARTSARRS
ncbi:MAG: lysylphosphatidylglycerol synthase transmembrane domain-containing protein [Candidatus Krumholzibacteriia bacterium]